MEVKECGGGSSYKQAMKKVWIQISKLPSEFRDFLTIWVIGTILGVTKDVDMPFTRTHNRARLQVLVPDPALIPNSCDVVIGDNIHELHFRVEPKEMQEAPIPLQMEDNLDDEDRGQDEGEGDDEERDYLQEDDSPNLSSKSTAQPDPKGKSVGQSTGQHQAEHLRGKDEDLMLGENTEGLVDLDDLEDVDDLDDLEEVYNEMKSPIAVVSGSSQVIPRAAAQGDLAAVPEATTPPRTSKRRADTIAEPSLERAERLKAARNLDATTKKGNDITSHISFLQFSDDLVVDNLSAVGISLGDNVESIACSVDCVKEVELNRLHTTVDADIISYVFDKEEKE
jgi:hypothetical protein